jgi:phosphatidylinositol alpha-mannosyltransferase
VSDILEAERFDVLHFHEPLLPAVPMTLLRLSRTANVGTFHAFARSNIGYHYGRPLLRPYLDYIHRGIAVSEPARAFFNKYFPEYPVRVIPNGVDLKTFRPGLAPIRHLRDERVNVLFVGRLEKRKGLGDLLRGYQFMRARFENCRLIIVGDGPLKPQVERFISDHRLPDVVMAGYVPDSVLPRYYASADIFCTPATGAESFGIVLLEAMASGLPIVATEVPGYMSVLESGRDSLTVRPTGWAELGAALLILARDADLRHRLGARGLERSRRFSWQAVASEIIEVYQEAREASGARIEVRDVHDAV